DDFIRVFGETAPMDVEKLSGEIVTRDALIGFKNLSGLRGIFHRYVNLKEAKDIKETVVIPDIIDISQECDMSEEQSVIYEELRARADALSKMTDAEKRDAIESGEKVDTTFGIIRDMDRVTTDMDLYKRQLTFVFPVSQKDKVDSLVSDLPEYLEVTQEEYDDDTGKTEKVKFFHYGNPKLSVKGDAYVLVVHETYEDEVTSRLGKFDIASRDVSHPVTPKYAKLIENLRTGLEDGKHIIFTEEKSQHAKLKRIIANSLGLDPNVIAIINAETVAGKKKRGAADDDAEQGSLEEIAIKYNAGDYQILICNKKAEVGINLHIGTAAVHHLTLPWTPASIKQRNGRGARVGAKQKSINAIYYVGKGSFDEFRLNGLKRKAEWMDKLFNGTEDSLENADADDAEQTNLLLAKDPEELAARMAAAKAKKEAEYQAAIKQRNQIDLANFIKANHDLTISPESVNVELGYLATKIKDIEDAIAPADKLYAERQAEFNEKYRAQLTDPKDPSKLKRALSKEQIKALGDWRDIREYERELELLTDARETSTVLRKDLQRNLRARTAQEVKLRSLENAARQIKRLRPSVEAAIKNGSVDVTMDVLTNARDYVLHNNRVFKVGSMYNYNRDIVRITSIDFFGKTATFEYKTGEHYVNVGQSKLETLGDEQTITQSEIDLLNLMSKRSLTVSDIKDSFTKDDFKKYLGNGKLRLNANKILIHTENGFGILSRYDLDAKNALEAVFPTSDDAELKKRLSKWLIENRKAAEDDLYSNPVEFYKAILGENWEEEYQQYGNIAAESVITQWAASMLETWLKTPEGASLELAEFDSNKLEGDMPVTTTRLALYMRDNIPTEYSNITQFDNMVEQTTKA
ncbi:MAG: helicase-related protein, partial [Shewanella sp.]